jgi:flavin reductase (DIM6/NTAB) family NADH-FMN oxidoreductase RutF
MPREAGRLAIRRLIPIRGTSIMEFNAQSLDARQKYKFITGCVVPRPIAWVSSVSADGTLNLAPFSFFMGVAGDPPTIAFACGPRGADSGAEDQGGHKDTLSNVIATREFVVNIVTKDLAHPMNVTSTSYTPEINEFEVAGLTPAPSIQIRAPRVAESPINMECRVSLVHEVGTRGNTLILGEVVHFHIHDALYDQKTGRVDMRKLHPISRMAGHLYADVDIFEMQRVGTYIG